MVNVERIVSAMEAAASHLPLLVLVGAFLLLLSGGRVVRWAGYLVVAVAAAGAVLMIAEHRPQRGDPALAVYALAALAGIGLAGAVTAVNRAGGVIALLLIAGIAGPTLSAGLHWPPRLLVLALIAAGLLWPAGAVALLSAAVFAIALGVQDAVGAGLLVAGALSAAALLRAAGRPSC